MLIRLIKSLATMIGLARYLQKKEDTHDSVTGVPERGADSVS
jgi:hypothetical protein